MRLVAVLTGMVLTIVPTASFSLPRTAPAFLVTRQHDGRRSSRLWAAVDDEDTTTVASPENDATVTTTEETPVMVIPPPPAIVEDPPFVIVTLTDEQDRVLRAVGRAYTRSDGDVWFNDAAVWARVQAEHAILADYTDVELRSAYVRQRPSLLDVLFLTPLGPVFAVNIAAWYFDFSFCDTPLRDVFKQCAVNAAARGDL